MSVDTTLENRLTALEAQHAEVVKERDELRTALTTERIGRRLATSKYVADKVAIPVDIIEASFRDSFRLEKDGVVGYDGRGSKIWSRARPGEPADFDEALRILVDQHPHRDSILKGRGASGDGGGNGGKNMSRTQFDALSPAARTAHIRNGGTLTD